MLIVGYISVVFPKYTNLCRDITIPNWTKTAEDIIRKIIIIYEKEIDEKIFAANLTETIKFKAFGENRTHDPQI